MSPIPRLSLSLRAWACGFLCLAVLPGLLCADEPKGAQTVIARVNGKPITTEQVQLQFFLDQAPPDQTEAARQQLIEKLIDRELIRQFLKTRKVVADPAQVDNQVVVIQKLIAERGEEIHDVLGKLHLNEESLKEVLALPLAWKSYVASVVTPAQLKSAWEADRHQLDGTRVAASQIVRILPPGAAEGDWKQAEAELADLRQQILDGKTTFAQAARDHSQSPSAQKGGDLGEFEYRGRVSQAISQAAFSLKPGDISAPFRTPSAVHIVHVREIIPGQLSPEDARDELLSRLGKQLWDRQVTELRQKSRIQMIP